MACLTFYTTEVWGLGVLFYGMSLFLSGGLVPLAMMPGLAADRRAGDPLRPGAGGAAQHPDRHHAAAQAPRILAVPGGDADRLWLCSHLIFRVAVRKVTVQGG